MVKRLFIGQIVIRSANPNLHPMIQSANGQGVVHGSEVLLQLIRSWSMQVQMDLVLIHRRIQLGIEDHRGSGGVLAGLGRDRRRWWREMVRRTARVLESVV